MADPVKLVPLTDRQPLNTSGGGGTFDPMEARVKALEEKIGKLDDKLDAVRVDLGYIKGKFDDAPTGQQFGELKGQMSALPGKGFIVYSTLTALTFFSALLVFKDKILSFLP